tara:strand:+ start:649 stop:975 length:327 start_codon:yes stop_codon:yes gene_type:complete
MATSTIELTYSTIFVRSLFSCFVVENAPRFARHRYGLLADSDDKGEEGYGGKANSKSQVTSGYIADIAQQLFLKDVSVDYAEVELQDQIGGERAKRASFKEEDERQLY